VVAFTVAAHEQNLVDGIQIRIGIERIDDVGELLPLGEVAGADAGV